MEKKYSTIIIVILVFVFGVFSYLQITNNLLPSITREGISNNDHSLRVSIQTIAKNGTAGKGVSGIVWNGEKNGFECFISSNQSTSNCDKKYSAGKIIRLYENSYSGGIFKGWGTGSCDYVNEVDSYSVCTITLDKDRAVNALFEESNN